MTFDEIAAHPDAKVASPTASFDELAKQEGAKVAAAPGMGESAQRGLEQGATFGFGDELQGRYKQLVSKLAGAEPAGGNTYEVERDKARAANAAAKEANPFTYGAAQVAGGAIPQAGAALVTGGGSIGAQAALGAAGATAQSLGEADKLDKAAVGNAGTAGIAGGLLGAAGAGAGKLLGQGVKSLGGKLASGAANALEDADAAEAGNIGEWLGDVKPGEAASSGMPAAQAKAFESAVAPQVAEAPKSLQRLAYEAAKARAPQILKDAGDHLLGLQPVRALGTFTKGAFNVAKDVAKDPASKRALFQLSGSVGQALATAPEHLGPYAHSIATAAAQGPGALNVLNFIKGNSDPGYQRVMAKLPKSED